MFVRPDTAVQVSFCAIGNGFSTLWFLNKFQPVNHFLRLFWILRCPMKLNEKPNRATKTEEKMNFIVQTTVPPPAPLTYNCNSCVFWKYISNKMTVCQRHFYIQSDLSWIVWGLYIFEKENWENGSICQQMWFPKTGWISSVYVYCLHVESFVHSTIVLSWRRQCKQTAHTFSDYGWIKVYQIVIKIRCTIKKE